MRIRTASYTDVEAIANLARDLARRQVAPHFSLEGQNNLDDALTAEAMRRYMSEGCRFHVVEDDDALLGVVAVRDNCHLLLLFVRDKAQGCGLARSLWEVAKTACLNAGYGGPFTVSAALSAVAMYERFGFIATGEKTDEQGIIRVHMTMTPTGH